MRPHSRSNQPTPSQVSRLDTLGSRGLRTYIPAPSENPAWWCNGSTSDSESLSPGSNPGRAILRRSLSTCDSERFALTATALLLLPLLLLLDFLPELGERFVVDLFQGLDGAEQFGVSFGFEVEIEFCQGHVFQ